MLPFLPIHSWPDVAFATLLILGLSGLSGAAIRSRWLTAFMAAVLSCYFLDDSSNSNIVHWFCQGAVFASIPAIAAILLYYSARVSSVGTNDSRTRGNWLTRIRVGVRHGTDVIDLYRRRNAVFYHSIVALTLTTLFLFGSWRAWWESVNRAESFDPTDFEWIYVFLMVLQVIGVVITILLFREVQADRIETPEDLFRVFRTSLLEAAVDKDGAVVLHHLAPFPGLFQMLSTAFEIVPKTSGAGGNSGIVAVGQWAGFLRDFDLAVENVGAAGRPRIILSMLQYWKVVDGKRQYKDSALYRFLVSVCRSEPVDPELSKMFRNSLVIAGPNTTLHGVARNIYHRVVLQLLERIERAVREEKILLFVRDPSPPKVLSGWERSHLGFTFIATHTEAYLGLPQVRGERIQFASLRVDFQREAVRALEELVRKDATWGYQQITPQLLTGDLVTDGIDPEAESV
jgi:hypothetical protein